MNVFRDIGNISSEDLVEKLVEKKLTPKYDD